MTTVVRYIQNTSTAAGVNIAVDASGGSESALIAVDVLCVAGIAAGATANVLQWTGSGKIKSISSVFMRRTATGEVIPMGAVAQNTHTTITLDAAGKTININLIAGAPAIPTNTTISFLLVIGY